MNYVPEISAVTGFVVLVMILAATVPFYLLNIRHPGWRFAILDVPISILSLFLPGAVSLVALGYAAGREAVWPFLKTVFGFDMGQLGGLVVYSLVIPLLMLGANIGIDRYFRGRKIILDRKRFGFRRFLLTFPALPIGALVEEIGWTAFLTNLFLAYYDPLITGLIIGLTWALWHVQPWRMDHSRKWTAGMFLLTVAMRVYMVLLYQGAWPSLYPVIVFHAAMNLTMEVYRGFDPYIYLGGFVLLIISTGL